MGLQATIAAAVKSGFTALGDIPRSISFTAVTPGAYDPATGLVSETTATTTCKAVFSDKPATASQGGLLDSAQPKSDRMLRTALIQQSELATRPKRGDRIVDGTSTYYVSSSAAQDPAKATWKVELELKA